MAILEKEIEEKASALPAQQRRRWTTAEYYKMAECGIFDVDERVELIDGEVIKLAPIGPEHSYTSGTLTERLWRILGSSFCVMHERPITLVDGTEPQPDLTIARGQRQDYRSRHPGPADICVVIEVCVSALDRDKKRKIPVYAREGIPEVWIVDVAKRRVEVYKHPEGAKYGLVQTHQTSDKIELSFLPGTFMSADEVLAG